MTGKRANVEEKKALPGVNSRGGLVSITRGEVFAPRKLLGEFARNHERDAGDGVVGAAPVVAVIGLVNVPALHAPFGRPTGERKGRPTIARTLHHRHEVCWRRWGLGLTAGFLLVHELLHTTGVSIVEAPANADESL